MIRMTAAILCLVALPSVALAGGTTKRIPAPPKLNGRVTTKAATWLKRPTGPVPVKSVAARWYTITVRDDSNRQNFHLVGPGVNKKTGVGFSGIVIWGAHLLTGRYRYGSDRAARRTWHTFRVVRG